MATVYAVKYADFSLRSNVWTPLEKYTIRSRKYQNIECYKIWPQIRTNHVWAAVSNFSSFKNIHHLGLKFKYNIQKYFDYQNCIQIQRTLLFQKFLQGHFVKIGKTVVCYLKDIHPPLLFRLNFIFQLYNLFPVNNTSNNLRNAPFHRFTIRNRCGHNRVGSLRCGWFRLVCLNNLLKFHQKALNWSIFTC